MTQTPYKTVSLETATKHKYVAVTDYYNLDSEEERDMLDKAIHTFRGVAIALVADGPERIQIWRKKNEVEFSRGTRRY